MKKIQAGGILRTSLDNSWQTPPEILERVRLVVGDPIPFDPASAPSNPTRATRFCAGAPGTIFAGEGLETRNGLEVAWDWPFFANPPYGGFLRGWLEKIAREATRLPERPGVVLLPCSRWEQRYFTRALGAAQLVCFVRGRVGFVSTADGARPTGNPSANMLLGINVADDVFARAMGTLGAVFSMREVAGGPA